MKLVLTSIAPPSNKTRRSRSYKCPSLSVRTCYLLSMSYSIGMKTNSCIDNSVDTCQAAVHCVNMTWVTHAQYLCQYFKCERTVSSSFMLSSMACCHVYYGYLLRGPICRIAMHGYLLWGSPYVVLPCMGIYSVVPICHIARHGYLLRGPHMSYCQAGY